MVRRARRHAPSASSSRPDLGRAHSCWAVRPPLEHGGYVAEKEEKIRRCPISPALSGRAGGWIRAADRNVRPRAARRLRARLPRSSVRRPAPAPGPATSEARSAACKTIELNARPLRGDRAAARRARYPATRSRSRVISAEGDCRPLAEARQGPHGQRRCQAGRASWLTATASA